MHTGTENSYNLLPLNYHQNLYITARSLRETVRPLLDYSRVIFKHSKARKQQRNQKIIRKKNFGCLTERLLRKLKIWIGRMVVQAKTKTKTNI